MFEDDVSFSQGGDMLIPWRVYLLCLPGFFHQPATTPNRAEDLVAAAPGNVGQAVITVPAYFNDAQRQATKAQYIREGSGRWSWYGNGVKFSTYS